MLLQVRSRLPATAAYRSEAEVVAGKHVWGYDATKQCGAAERPNSHAQHAQPIFGN
jgi:hypothetical protein